MSWVPKSEALALAQARFAGLELTEKTFLNWAKAGGECPPVKQGNRIGFDAESLDAWLSRLEAGLVTLDQEDYKRCFEFAVEAYYSPMTKADFSRAKQRDVGEFLTNQIRGKLGEVAVQKLLGAKGIAIELDFRVDSLIPSQDIERVSVRGRVWNNPAKKVSIKATKLKNILLAVSVNEATLPDRKSDLYVLSQVDLFPDHLLRVLKNSNVQLVQKAAARIPEFKPIRVRVAGWASHADLTLAPALPPAEINARWGIPMAAPNFILTSGQLSTNWDELIAQITGIPLAA